MSNRQPEPSKDNVNLVVDPKTSRSNVTNTNTDTKIHKPKVAIGKSYISLNYHLTRTSGACAQI